jgi:DNA-binding GntR family transcriptional regulator
MPQQRYEQVAADLRAKIESGVYPPGTPLPSWSQIGREYGVSHSVVAKVMMLLRAAGLVETLDGVGVFVRDAE